MPSQTNEISVLLADDQPLARAGLRKLLEGAKDIQVVGEAPDGFIARQMVRKLHPRVLLLDLKMPGVSAAELERWVRKNYPQTTTLILTAHNRAAYLATMIDEGAAGYFDKDVQAEQLIMAIRAAVRGEILFDKSQLLRAREWHEEVGDKLRRLSQREREVLDWLEMGLDNKDIAKTLDLSTKTVSYHMTNLLAKLQVKSRQEAVIWALKNLSDDLE